MPPFTSCPLPSSGYRHTRAWLAKKAVDSKRVEVGLTSRVSKLADRLATAGGRKEGISDVLRQVRNSRRLSGEMDIDETYCYLRRYIESQVRPFNSRDSAI